MSNDLFPDVATQDWPVMQPVMFDGCFGWLHMPAKSADRGLAVVLCSGLRRDATNVYRPFRLLADQLAAQGHPVLRFNYAGTGDSCDIKDIDAWAVWQQNVMAAADYVMAATGARRVVLIGLRIGAALATLVATKRRDVAGLVLLDPVLRGKSYMTQLSIEARLRNHGLPDQRDGLLLDELCLTNETVQRIGQVDLRTVAPPAECSVVIFGHDQTSGAIACAEIWASKGVSATSKGFKGLESLLRPAHLADEPVSDFMPIMLWLRETFPAESPDQSTADVPGSSIYRSNKLPAVMLRPPGCVETPLRFGERHQLFGMLCRPDKNAQCDLAVIIGNAGGDPHHGYARFSVELARRLAARGIASLRIDFAGLGDSISPSDSGAEGATHVFEVDRANDFAAAIDVLEPMGYRRFAVHGLCSGAYHAFHASLADHRITALLLINLPWFTLRHERSAPNSFARRSIAELSRRDVALLLLFAAGDAGIRPLEQHFGPAGADLRGSDNVDVSIVPGLDHDLTGHAMRQDVAERMIAFLQQLSAYASTDEFSTIPAQPNAAALHPMLIT